MNLQFKQTITPYNNSPDKFPTTPKDFLPLFTWQRCSVHDAISSDLLKQVMPASSL